MWLGVLSKTQYFLLFLLSLPLLLFAFRPYSSRASFQLQSSIKVSGDFLGQLMLFIISVFVRRISAWVEEVGMMRRLRIEAVNLSINSESSFVIYWLGKWIYQSDSSSVLNRALFSRQNFVFILFGSYLLSATSSTSNSQKIIPGAKNMLMNTFEPF